MTVLSEIEQNILEAISHRRKGSPVPNVRLAELVGLRPRATGKDGADVREAVHALRVKGYPICASGKGYYWPETKQELHDFIQSLQNRTHELQEAIDGLQAGYNLVGGPEAVRAVQEVLIKRFQTREKVYEVRADQVDRFLEDHPDAIEL